MSPLEFTRGNYVEVPEWVDESEPDEVVLANLNAFEDATRVSCVHCGELPTEDGHDHCIANLPGVRFACCGHGVLENTTRRSHCYVVFDDGLTLRDTAAFEAIQMLGGNPAPLPNDRKRPGWTVVEHASEAWLELMWEEDEDDESRGL